MENVSHMYRGLMNCGASSCLSRPKNQDILIYPGDVLEIAKSLLPR